MQANAKLLAQGRAVGIDVAAVSFDAERQERGLIRDPGLSSQGMVQGLGLDRVAVA